MEQHREKDALDVAIDFFLGAVVGVLLGSGVFFALKFRFPFISGHAYWICLFAGVTITGSLTGLFRNRVKKKPKKGLLLAPVNEELSIGSKVVLWGLFVVGGLSLFTLVVLRS